MAESANDALLADSTALNQRNPMDVLNHIVEWQASHPGATEYVVHTEEEAGKILVAMGAFIADQVKHQEDNDMRRAMIDVEQRYRHAVLKASALKLMREMTEEDQLYFVGLKLVASRVVLQ